jgi:hypothetical protein
LSYSRMRSRMRGSSRTMARMDDFSHCHPAPALIAA